MLAITHEQRMERCNVKIMRHAKWRAIAGVMMIGKTRFVRSSEPEGQSIPTACTDGKNIWFNRDFMDTLSDPELRFVKLHEEYHKMYRHLTTWRHLFEQDPRLANFAADYVINIGLVDADDGEGFIKMPECGLLDEKFRGWDVARVFYHLLDNPPPSGGSGGEGEPQGFDTHDWDGAQALTEEEQEELGREIQRALRQGKLASDKMGGGNAIDIKDLIEPQVDWRRALEEFITEVTRGGEDETWDHPDRRWLGAELYMPGDITEEVGEAVIGPDTSGSNFGESEVRCMLSEVAGILKHVKPRQTHLMYWDTQIQGHEVYQREQTDDIVNSTKPVGGGGTTPSCVSDYIRDQRIRPEFVIMMTDGYVFNDWGSWDCPVLWMIIDNPDCVPPSGKALHVKASQLN